MPHRGNEDGPIHNEVRWLEEGCLPHLEVNEAHLEVNEECGFCRVGRWVSLTEFPLTEECSVLGQVAGSVLSEAGDLVNRLG